MGCNFFDNAIKPVRMVLLMRSACIFVVLLAIYSIYEQVRVFVSEEEAIAGQIVIGYVFFLVYLCLLLGFSIQIHLWNKFANRSRLTFFVEKIGFVYVLLLWRHKYNPLSLFYDGTVIALAVTIILLWLASSSSIAEAVVRLARQTVGSGIPPDLVPGRTLEQRLFNSTMLATLVIVMPVLFWGVDYIFAKR